MSEAQEITIVLTQSHVASDGSTITVNSMSDGSTKIITVDLDQVETIRTIPAPPRNGFSPKVINNWKMFNVDNNINFIDYANANSKFQGSNLNWNNGLLQSVLPLCLYKRVAIDIGASYGFVTNELASAFETVLSSEIVEEIRDYLTQNVNHNSNVQVLNYGFWQVDGRMRINFYPENTGYTSAVLDHDNSIKIGRVCPVKPLDFIAGNRTDVDLIKISVEGAELQILEGASQTLFNNDPVLLIQMFEHRLESQAAVFNLLSNYNYNHVSTSGEIYVFTKT